MDFFNTSLCGITRFIHLIFFFSRNLSIFFALHGHCFLIFLILLAAKGASPSKILNSNVHSSRPRISLERVEISSELVARTRGGLKLDVKKEEEREAARRREVRRVSSLRKRWMEECKVEKAYTPYSREIRHALLKTAARERFWRKSREFLFS